MINDIVSQVRLAEGGLTPVGASLLAMDVNDDACCLAKRGACEFIASGLAPTGVVWFLECQKRKNPLSRVFVKFQSKL